MLDHWLAIAAIPHVHLQQNQKDPTRRLSVLSVRPLSARAAEQVVFPAEPGLHGSASRPEDLHVPEYGGATAQLVALPGQNERATAAAGRCCGTYYYSRKSRFGCCSSTAPEVTCRWARVFNGCKEELLPKGSTDNGKAHAPYTALVELHMCSLATGIGSVVTLPQGTYCGMCPQNRRTRVGSCPPKLCNTQKRQQAP